MITPSTTHQQTQTIVDTVGGIYQNTLTIAQSVTGDNLYGYTAVWWRIPGEVLTEVNFMVRLCSKQIQ